ncbi:hypothetical protein ABH904_000834 [Pseudomonas frederiksbergensis]
MLNAVVAGSASSRASPLPHLIGVDHILFAWHISNVGAGLLAKAV